MTQSVQRIVHIDMDAFYASVEVLPPKARPRACLAHASINASTRQAAQCAFEQHGAWTGRPLPRQCPGQGQQHQDLPTGDGTYERTTAKVCFSTPAAAQAAGYRGIK